MLALGNRSSLAAFTIGNWGQRKISFRGGALAIACLGLGGCAVKFDYPSVTDAVLTASGHKVTVESLHCGRDGSVIAAGYTESLTHLEGVAFHSSDGGVSWRQARIEPSADGVPLSILAMPQERDFSALYLSGYRDGEAVLSNIFKFSHEPGPWWTTSDHGQSWHRANAPLPLPMTGVVDARTPTLSVIDQTGTLITAMDDYDNGLVLLRSTNASATWSRQSLPALHHYASLVSDGSGFAAVTGRSVRDGGVIYWSTDSGVTWNESHLATEDAFPFRFPKAMRLYRSSTGGLLAFNNDSLGKGKSPAWLFTSQDAGKTWHFVRSFDELGRVVGIAGNTAGRIVAITEWGNILLSDDDGGTWRQGVNPIVTETQVSTSNVVMSAQGVVLATLDRAAFIQSTDGGETWRAVDSRLPNRQFVLDSYCTDGNGWIVIAGSGGMVTRSNDWGATWQRGQLFESDGLSHR